MAMISTEALSIANQQTTNSPSREQRSATHDDLSAYSASSWSFVSHWPDAETPAVPAFVYCIVLRAFNPQYTECGVKRLREPLPDWTITLCQLTVTSHVDHRVDSLSHLTRATIGCLCCLFKVQHYH